MFFPQGFPRFLLGYVHNVGSAFTERGKYSEEGDVFVERIKGTMNGTPWNKGHLACFEYPEVVLYPLFGLSGYYVNYFLPSRVGVKRVGASRGDSGSHHQKLFSSHQLFIGKPFDGGPRILFLPDVGGLHEAFD